ncbi:MAG: hypothetical protein HZA90_26255 [Verrucomicrobia bacterium]|nr:hypothetical protein [Verrucomicrobiota bacterium]
MAWNDNVGTWFKLGRAKLPSLETWKTLSAVRGAPRTGAILKVDAALAAAQQVELDPDFLVKQMAAFELFLACDAMLRGLGFLDLQAKQRKEAVEELKRRAKEALDFFGAAAPVVQAILSRPTDILQLKLAGTSLHVIVDRVFNNFVTYARAHWQYSATSGFGGDDLLAGRTNSVPCGGIAGALQTILKALLGRTEAVPRAQFNGYFLAKKEYACYDPLVRGNVRDRAGHYDGACLFSSHHYLQWGGLFYDPCLTHIYTNDRQMVAEELVKMTGAVACVKPNPRRNDFIYVNDLANPPHGFGSSWTRVKIGDVTSVGALQNLLPSPLKEKLNSTSSEAIAIANFCAKIH